MIRICQYLDSIGCCKTSDKILNKYAQFIQPSNNANWPIDTRVIPWKEVEDSFKQRDKDWFKNFPPMRTPEYMALDGVFEPPAYAADGGTNNIKPEARREVNQKTINKLQQLLLGYDIDPEERKKIEEQIAGLGKLDKNADYLAGNPFDMQGADDVPGPKQAIIDHTSPSMIGLDSFTWKNRRDTFDNSAERYKLLLPN